jgi:hypothetical protein
VGVRHVSVTDPAAGEDASTPVCAPSWWYVTQSSATACPATALAVEPGAGADPVDAGPDVGDVPPEVAVGATVPATGCCGALLHAATEIVTVAAATARANGADRGRRLYRLTSPQRIATSSCHREAIH